MYNSDRVNNIDVKNSAKGRDTVKKAVENNFGPKFGSKHQPWHQNRQSDWKNLNERLCKLRHSHAVTQAITQNDLLNHLTKAEQVLITAFSDIDLSYYAIKTPYLGIEETPAGLIILDEGHPSSQSADYDTKRQYLPQPVATAFETMRAAFRIDHPEKRLLVASGYRSPAYQLTVLASYYVRVHSFDLQATLRQVALPSYSQHCSASHAALDLANANGQPSDSDGQDFAMTIEYAWLKQHAAKYNFHESYPLDNPDGIMWEPWHWQYVPNAG